MSAGSPSHGSGNSQDFELNLAPIIDCFTVLITFMLISASFLAVGILDAGAGVMTQPVQGETPPPVAVEVQLHNQFQATVKLSGKSSQTFQIGPSSPGAQAWNFDALENALKEVKSKWPTTDSVLLTADDSVEYLNVIQFMEKIRKIIPGIALGGF
ncbi:MAG: biopolymer transporter ExbD [Bdellovibrio sp.]|nr:biopolymer transporter ExbD [Bdellovibrio sp.]